MATIRLILKLQRLEVIILSMALAALTAAILIVVALLNSIDSDLAACQEPLRCEALRGDNAFFASLIPALSLMSVGAATFAGLLLGVPAVAAEIERGTAPLTWSMSPAREVWFLRRVLVMAGVLTLVTIPPSIATDLLIGASYPDVDVAHSFEGFEVRGPVIIARAIAAFGVGTLAGALAGKQLPALLLAILGSTALLAGVQTLHDGWLRAEAVQLPSGASGIHSLVFDVRYVLPDGRIVDLGTALGTLEGTGSHPASVYPARYVGIPGAYAPEKRAREIAAILLVGLASGAAATVVVNRRRPY